MERKTPKKGKPGKNKSEKHIILKNDNSKKGQFWKGKSEKGQIWNGII